MPDDDHSAISAQDANRLFADWKTAPAIVLAVSGGPDSMALMWLAARWRRALAQGPRLFTVTIDHGLRAESAAEARAVKCLARSLELPHRTMRWTGPKPKTGLPAAARAARYRLLAQAARAHGATHIFTAHTRDDQAETLLMRMMRGEDVGRAVGPRGLRQQTISRRPRRGRQSGFRLGSGPSHRAMRQFEAARQALDVTRLGRGLSAQAVIDRDGEKPRALRQSAAPAGRKPHQCHGIGTA